MKKKGLETNNGVRVQYSRGPERKRGGAGAGAGAALVTRIPGS